MPEKMQPKLSKEQEDPDLAEVCIVLHTYNFNICIITSPYAFALNLLSLITLSNIIRT